MLDRNAQLRLLLPCLTIIVMVVISCVTGRPQSRRSGEIANNFNVSNGNGTSRPFSNYSNESDPISKSRSKRGVVRKAWIILDLLIYSFKRLLSIPLGISQHVANLNTIFG